MPKSIRFRDTLRTGTLPGANSHVVALMILDEPEAISHWVIVTLSTGPLNTGTSMSRSHVCGLSICAKAQEHTRRTAVGRTEDMRWINVAPRVAVVGLA